jgi:hypothetical protein
MIEAPVEIVSYDSSCTARPGLSAKPTVDITHNLSPTEIDRLSGCLARLIPHVRLESIAITGGVGMQLGLAGLGRPAPRDEIADLDLVAASVDAITPGVVEQFLVSHYHVVRPGVPKFMIQLVDPVSCIRVDVFPDLLGSLADAQTIAIGEHSVQLLPLERILEHKVLTLSRASPSAPIDPKHVDAARVLGDVLGRMVPSVAWEALVPDVYGIEADASCERCTLSSHPSWPLAPKDRIFKLLGWNQTAKLNSRKAIRVGEQLPETS